MKRKKINISILDNQDSVIFDEKEISANIENLLEFVLNKNNVVQQSAIKKLDFEKISIDFVFCNDEEIQKINRDFRQKDKPTDVISFASFADIEHKMIFDGEINLGEIIVSTETTQKQARENNLSFYEEFYFLISHGILHLLGFDHQDEVGYEFMMKLQKEMISSKNYS
jgi:probable rRNA maturation factor